MEGSAKFLVFITLGRGKSWTKYTTCIFLLVCHVSWSVLLQPYAMKLCSETDETNERNTFFIFGFTLRPFIKSHPSVAYHVFFKKFGSTLCSPYNFFFVPRCLQLLFTASDSGGSSAREQKNWRRLTSKRLINNTRKSSGMKWGTSVMALKRTQLVKRLFI